MIASKTQSIPAYRSRKGYTQAIVTLTDAATAKRKDYWLGEHGSPLSYEVYHRVLAEWESRGRRLPPPTVCLPESEPSDHQVTIDQIIAVYKVYVQQTYKQPSQQTIYMALGILQQFHGNSAVEAFGPKRLRSLRDQMISGDPTSDPPRKPWSRTTINKAMHQIVAMFKWAASHEMLPATVHQQLKTVGALRRGHSQAAEPDSVQPIAIEVVEATKRHLSRQVKALIDLQLFTGARGGELFTLRSIDLEIDNDSGVWWVRPKDHKTAHHGHQRIIYFGPKAQEVIRPFITDRAVDAYLFSPAEAEAERRAKIAARRKTPLKQGHTTGTNRVRIPKRKPGTHYRASSYRCAIQRACVKANVPCWHPHQLRHTAATLIRREFGLETARIALGHSSALVTDAVYAERDMERVIQVMQKLG